MAPSPRLQRTLLRTITERQMQAVSGEIADLERQYLMRPVGPRSQHRVRGPNGPELNAFKADSLRATQNSSHHESQERWAAGLTRRAADRPVSRDKWNFQARPSRNLARQTRTASTQQKRSTATLWQRRPGSLGPQREEAAPSQEVLINKIEYLRNVHLFPIEKEKHSFGERRASDGRGKHPQGVQAQERKAEAVNLSRKSSRAQPLAAIPRRTDNFSHLGAKDPRKSQKGLANPGMIVYVGAEGQHRVGKQRQSLQLQAGQKPQTSLLKKTRDL